jgi:hypothetical protein
VSLPKEVVAIYKFIDARSGRYMEVQETPKQDAVVILMDHQYGYAKITLSREQWRALCNLRDRVRVKSVQPDIAQGAATGASTSASTTASKRVAI